MNSSTSTGMTMSGQDWALLVILSVLWGGTFAFVKIALVGFAPLTLVFGRVLLAALALLGVLLASGVGVPRGAPVWIALAGMGLLNNVLPFSLIFWGQNALPPGIAASLASMLNATTPVFGVVAAHFLTRDEKLTVAKAIGVAAGLAGVAIMLAPWSRAQAADGWGTESPRAMLGVGACLLAALIYGFAGIYGRRFKAMGVAPMQTAFGQLAASSVVMCALALIVDRPWRAAVPGLAPIAALVALALLSTALAYVIYFRILGRAGATNLLLVTFLIPITSVALGTAFLGEGIGLAHVAGMAVIGLALAVIDGRLLRLAAARR